MAEYIKCFVPWCNNNSASTPDKIIVRIRGDLRKEWCRAFDVEYFKVYTQYCCEDHFDETSSELPLQSSSESELYKILTEPQPSTSKKRKYETCVGSATTSSISEDVSQLPIKVSMHTQCKAIMLDKTTQYKVRKLQHTSPPKVSTPRTISSHVSNSPSMFDGGSDIETSFHFGMLRFYNMLLLYLCVLRK